MEKYRLQYWGKNAEWLAVKIASNGNRDFYVWAIRENTDTKEHDAKHKQMHEYTEPMTLEETKIFISLFGPNGTSNKMLNRCIGLTLEEACRNISFDEINLAESGR